MPKTNGKRSMTTPMTEQTPKKSRVLFNEGGKSQKYRKTNKIMEMCQTLAKQEEITMLEVICYLGTRYYHKKNRKIYEVFENLSKLGENFESTSLPKNCNESKNTTLDILNHHYS